MKSYLRWKGTHYLYGGTNRQGVDCSSLTRHIYQESFGIHLPRTTYRQIKTGKRIAIPQLRIGDLVFFHTGRYERHVGIYLGDQKFIHASKIKGVTISKMNNVYWRNKFLDARRLN
ncbi:NlpC/P60 family protein [Rahnella ecdela]|uniref:C40 family peptidase n=1 Tax=Rahnella ecdela TaxID=2816250 RepID=A0ABS6L9Q5_9GAMM|nr:C40 family peptidase [Rahnella ecdela]